MAAAVWVGVVGRLLVGVDRAGDQQDKVIVCRNRAVDVASTVNADTATDNPDDWLEAAVGQAEWCSEGQRGDAVDRGTFAAVTGWCPDEDGLASRIAFGALDQNRRCFGGDTFTKPKRCPFTDVDFGERFCIQGSAHIKLVCDIPSSKAMLSTWFSAPQSWAAV